MDPSNNPNEEDTMTTHTPLRVRAHELKAGDFLDTTVRTDYIGPRGGKSYVPAWRVESAVESVTPGWSNLRHPGLVVKTVSGRSLFVTENTVCNIRRSA